MSKDKTIAIIPVRGGSQGIPRKNARLLAGKPLLAYSVESAIGASCIDVVYVSTDNEELAEIARRYGAKVISRPLELACDDVGLDEVILGAVNQIEQTGIKVSQVITIQATCPLISSHTIDKVCSMQANKDFDTVLTIVDNTHLGWTKNRESEIVPIYESRVNRQLLPRNYRETGGVVACSREILNSGSRFGNKVGVIEVGKTEAIDIDDYFDWWMAEKSLNRRRICFHIVGNRLCGLGHVYRTLTLVDRLIDHDLWFIVNADSEMAAEIIRNRFYTVKVVTPGKEAEEIIKDSPDMVINDILDTEEEFISSLKNAGIAVINFEDLGPGSERADYIINAMYDSHPNINDGRVLHGIEYCCLRDEFYSAQTCKPAKEVGNVLMLFGGTDPAKVTAKTLQWIDEVEGNFNVTVIVGIGNDNLDQIKQIASNLKHETNVISDTSIISSHMAKADIAITSAGRTVFELASMGVPMMVISQNEKETNHIFAQSSPGVMYCGQAGDIGKDKFLDSFKRLIGDEKLRRTMNKELLGSPVRKGIDNVLGLIESALKFRNRKDTNEN